MTWFNDKHQKKPKNGRADDQIQKNVDGFMEGFSAAYKEALEWSLGKTDDDIRKELKRRYGG